MVKKLSTLLGLIGLGALVQTCDGEEEACPCVKDVNVTELSAFNERDMALVGVSTGFRYPLTYGFQGCRDYDMDLVGGECATKLAVDRPPWCESQWCFVNKTTCFRPNDDFPDFGNDFPYYLSYETCGFLNSYNPQRAFNLDDEIWERPLRISFPNDASNGYTIHEWKGKKSGLYPMFLERLFTEANIQYETHNISNDALARYPQSSYSACVVETALNRTDLCIGDFWSTPVRQLESTFTISVTEDLFYMVTFSNTGESVRDMMARPFKPFALSVWILIIATIFVVSMVQMFLESKESCLTKKTILDYLYWGWMSFTTAGPLFTPTRKSSALVNCAFGFFLLVVIASYTAELASFLVLSSSQVAVKNLEDAFAHNYKVCMMFAIQEPMEAKFARLKVLGVYVEDTIDVLQGMDTGLCEVGVVAMANFDGVRRNPTITETHCDKELILDEVLFSVSVALPVNNVYQPYISYLIQKGRTLGWLDDARVESKSIFLTAERCSSNHETSGDLYMIDANDHEALTLQDMGGLFIMMGIILLIAIFFYLWKECDGNKLIGEIKENVVRGSISSEASETDSKVELDVDHQHGNEPKPPPNHLPDLNTLDDAQLINLMANIATTMQKRQTNTDVVINLT